MLPTPCGVPTALAMAVDDAEIDLGIDLTIEEWDAGTDEITLSASEELDEAEEQSIIQWLDEEWPGIHVLYA